MIKIGKYSISVLFSLFFFLSFPLLAQDARGTLLGLVTDSSKAVVPGATVTAFHKEMGTSSQTITNDTGNYELPYLLPGVYRVEVELTGFKKYSREPIEVRVGDSVTLNIALDIGSISETVNVTAETPLLNSSTASVGSVVEHRLLEDLPLAGGNVMYLARFSTGVVSGQAPGHNWLPSAIDVMSNLTIAGTRSGNSEFTLDGIPNMTQTSASFAPPPDMVQEFRVQVVSYDASVGHAAGASINTSLKAGTNRIRGTGTWDYAPTSLQAVDFFTNGRLWDPATGPVTDEKKEAMLPPRNLHRYSATIGGPLVLPWLYNGRNRTFWTYGFQGFNRRQRNNDFFTVPTTAERNGDFSALLAIGTNYQIYDPATIKPAAGGRFSRLPFVGNKIPASRLDPLAKSLLSYYPLPNATGTVDGRNNFNTVSENNNDFYQNMARVDHELSDRHRIFGRFTQSWLHFYRNRVFDNEARGLDRFRKQWGFGFDDVYVFSNHLVLNSRYGWTGYNETDRPQSLGFNLSSVGIPASLVPQLNSDATAFPMYSVDGYATLGESTNYYWTTNYHNFASTLSWIRGTHSVKMGGELRLFREHNYNWGNASPQMNFALTWTRGPLDNSPTAPIGQGLASFLLGVPTGGGVDNNASFAIQSHSMALFIHDDWKATRRLTVNLGVRWDYDTPITERFDRANRDYDFKTPNPVEATAQANYAKAPIPEVPVSQFKTTGGMTYVNQNGNPRGTFQTEINNFSPRIGLVYQLTAKTVTRVGYGIYFQPVSADRIGINQPGYNLRTNLIPSNDNGLTFIATLANPFPTGLQKPAPVNLTTFVGRGVTFQPVTRDNTYMQRWSFSVQREFPARTVVEVTYLGNRGTRLGIDREQNAVPAKYLSKSPERDQATIDYLGAQVANPFYGMPEFTGSGLTGRNVSRSQLLRPYPHFQGLAMSEAVGYSWYHSLEVRLEKRFGSGFGVNGGYTWSKMMEAQSFLNDSDLYPEKVIGGQDRPHRLTVGSVWELPVGRGRWVGTNMNRWLDAALGGWQLQAIYQAQTGPPIGFGNIIYRGDLHNIVLPSSERIIQRWFNTNAPFERDSTKQLASNIRTFPSNLTGLRAPGDNYWDVSLSKNFRIKEGVRMQFRTQWEGALNHPQFSPPNTGVNNTLFGSISSIRGEGRRILLGAKVIF